MQYRIQLNLSHRRGTPLRVLSLVERRQFQIRSVRIEDAAKVVRCDLLVDVGAIPVDSLAKQLAALVDVESVQVLSVLEASSLQAQRQQRPAHHDPYEPALVS